MLLVSFKAARSRFAIPARSVEEITPLVELNLLPGAPFYIAGLMNHRGKSLPVADMSALLSGSPSRRWASTRIMVVRPIPDLLLGLMAERVLKTVELAEDALAAPGAPAAPYVLGVATLGEDLIQVLDAVKVLPPELLESLRAAQEAA